MKIMILTLQRLARLALCLSDAIRDIATVQSGFLIPGVNEGFDYGNLKMHEN